MAQDVSNPNSDFTNDPTLVFEEAGVEPQFDSYIDFGEIAAPADPGANVARFYCKDDGGTTKLFFRDSAGTETELGGGGVAVGDSPSWTGAHDFGGATSLELPNGAAPTVNADGEIAVDTTITDFSAGLIKYYSGEEMAVVAMPVAQLTSPTDAYVVAYNATNDEFELVAAPGGASISAGDSNVTVTDAGTGNVTIDLDGSTVYQFDSDGINGPDGSATNPAIHGADADTGIYFAPSYMAFTAAGTARFRIGGVNFISMDANGPQISNGAPSSTTPSLIPNRADPDCGLGRAAVDQLSLIAGGVEIARCHEGTTDELIIIAPESAPADADLPNGYFTVYHDTGTPALVFKHKDSGGTVRTASVTLS